MKVSFIKSQGGTLVAADVEAEKFISRLQVGDGVIVEAKKARSLLFHRKAFALLNLAFETWDPDPKNEYMGLGIQKNFDRFRKDITILAGYYSEVWDIRGELRLEPKSLSFESMDDVEFEGVYQSILTVVWNKVLKDAAKYESESEVERVVNELLRF